MMVGGTLSGTMGGIEVAPPKAVAEWDSGDGGVHSIEDSGTVLFEGLTGGWEGNGTGASNICGSMLFVFALGAWRMVSFDWRIEARWRVDVRSGLRRTGGATGIFCAGVSGGAIVWGRVVVGVRGRSMVVLAGRGESKAVAVA